MIETDGNCLQSCFIINYKAPKIRAV